jgi:hypothetical protein
MYFHSPARFISSVLYGVPILESITKVEGWHIQYHILVLCPPHLEVNPTPNAWNDFTWEGGVLVSDEKGERDAG